ncbi:NADH-quinone oxidoreductase subunit NuoG [Acidicapsa ligni]|uniref:NADH-quinone oxidoreductase subunit NuoG n=1 Tax=Acidicapsa ligni TaxID=542300 RepID=UPI0021DFAEF8|nr:NADH-quinone oxidoreductase subunit NuoG [Acidicapsa ligni]
MADVTFTVDGKKLTAPAGTLLIEACRKAGIEIPAFCYYPGLSLQAACRMCVVRQEKVPKLQTACTVQVGEGQSFITESPEITQARKATIELLLGNHPLDCPVCDAGGECELQDMTFKYGAGESLYVEAKQHREEQKWSPAVYFDRPRCILCYRCVRMCGEGMDVWALGIQNRGASAIIAPNGGDHLDCEQCGMCIDACPVGALTSGTYRYKTRPWEMNHVATVCTHCGDGCKTTLGIRQVNDGAEIVRADNRDKSGINGDFLCAKGRFGFDFVESADRLTKPLIRNAAGKLEPATWEQAIRLVASKFKEVRDRNSDKASSSSIGVIGSNTTTNEENYLLQKFARTALNTNNIDHERTTDYAGFAHALAGTTGRTASLRDTQTAKAVLLIGGNPTEEHPLLAWNLRTNFRLNQSRLYITTDSPIKLERQAIKSLQLPVGLESNGYEAFTEFLNGSDSAIEATSEAKSFREAIEAEESLIVIFGEEYRGQAIESLVKWGLKKAGVKFAYLGDYANSRGAADMGLLPNLLPGYVPVASPAAFTEEYIGLPTAPGKNAVEIFDAAGNGELGALYVVGSNPVATFGVNPAALKSTFVVVQDIFLTETAALADVVLPSASLYEKTGTVTNSYGDVQLAKKAADKAGVKPDFEIIVRIAGGMGIDVKKLVPFGKTNGVSADMGQSRGAQSGEADRHAVWLTANHLEPRLSPFDPLAVLDEIERLIPAYKLDRLNLFGGNDVASEPGFVPVSSIASARDLILPSHDGLFTSGILGAHTVALQELNQYQHQFEHPVVTETAAD